MNHAPQDFLRDPASPISTGGLYRRVLLTIMLATFALVLCIPLAYANEAREIKVGVVLDQSSINADLARDYLAGARAFFDHHNSRRGANSRITLIVKDDEGDAAKTVVATRELIEQDKVVALFGYVGDENVAAVAADAIFKRSRVALYAPLSGDVVSAIPDTIFYARPTYREEARYLINHFSQLGSKNFLVVSTDTNMSNRLATQVADELVLQKLRTPTRINIPADYKGLREIAQRVLQINPQVIVLATDTITSAEFIKNFRAIDKGTNIVAFSTVNHRTLMELAKPEFAAGTMITQVVPHPDLPISKVQTEHLLLMAKYRDEPPSHITLEGFIAAKSFVNAIGKTNATSRAAILTALSGDRRYDIGGITLAFTSANDRGSKFVDLAFLRKSGKLIQ
jgi:branched-chain amino acid transport system substrate-binding protein